MKLLKIAFRIIVGLFVLSAPLLSGCEPTEAVEKALPSRSAVLGDWQMTRGAITPELPVPDLITGMFLSGKSTWKITGDPKSSKASRITFDGRDVWFKVPGLGVRDLNIEASPRLVNEESINLVRATGGGAIKASRVSLIGLPEFTDVAVNYKDTIHMKFDYSNDGDTVEVLITVQVTGGSYTMDGALKSITPYSATVVYTGVKR